MNPYASATQWVEALRDGSISVRALVGMHLERRQRLAGRVNAIVSTNDPSALAAASDADDPVADRDRPLHGLPITIKDGIHVAGWPSTGGVLDPAQARATEDAANVQQLRGAGAIVIGKTNVPVANADWQTVNPRFGRTTNPYDPARTSGGSTGGGAAAVATGLSVAELGSDIGGSIRIPAAFCGLYGHKPTSAALPRSGHYPGGHTPNPARGLGVQGPLARSAADLELLFGVLCQAEGLDGKGLRSQPPPPRFESLEGARVGVLKLPDWLPVDASILSARDGLSERLAGLGAQIVPLDARPWFGDFREYYASYLVALQCLMSGGLPVAARAKAALKMRGYGDPFLDAVADGLEASAARLLDVLEAFETCKLAWEQAFERVDVLLTPVCSVNAFPHDDGYFYDRTLDVDGTAMPYYRLSALPALASVAGLPATVFPTGQVDAHGVPIGLQVMAAYFEDRTALRFARLVEESIVGFRAPPGFD